MDRIAAIQITSNEKISENLEKIEHWIHEASLKKANCVLLPENFAFMGSTGHDKLRIAEMFGEGPIQDFLGKLSKLKKMWIVAGTLPLLSTEKDRVCASCLVFNPEGQCVARYDKIHLFDVEIDDEEKHVESETIFPGDQVVSLETSFGKIGLSVCYDLRFPELYRKLFNAGAEILMVPSAFTQKTGLAHFEVLLRARAIENFSYVVAANQSGLHNNGRQTFGHSMIVDPWGKVVDRLPEGEGVVIADINRDYLKDIRRRFPVFQHQRFIHKD